MTQQQTPLPRSVALPSSNTSTLSMRIETLYVHRTSRLDETRSSSMAHRPLTSEQLSAQQVLAMGLIIAASMGSAWSAGQGRPA